MKVRAAYTLLELLIVLTLASVLTLLGVAAWQKWSVLQEKRLVAVQLHQTIRFARKAALAHREQVSVCAAASEMTCGTNWSLGMIIFLNPDNQGQPTSDNILMHVPALTKKQQLIWHGWLGHTMLRFEADGLPHAYHGSFYFGLPGKEKPLVIMNAVGRVRIEG